MRTKVPSPIYTACSLLGLGGVLQGGLSSRPWRAAGAGRSDVLLDQEPRPTRLVPLATVDLAGRGCSDVVATRSNDRLGHIAQAAVGVL